MDFIGGRKVSNFWRKHANGDTVVYVYSCTLRVRVLYVDRYESTFVLSKVLQSTFVLSKVLQSTFVLSKVLQSTFVLCTKVPSYFRTFVSIFESTKYNVRVHTTYESTFVLSKVSFVRKYFRTKVLPYLRRYCTFESTKVLRSVPSR